MQEEWITICKRCGAKLYCQDGFFQGIQLPDGTSLCFDCDADDKQNHLFENELH